MCVTWMLQVLSSIWMRSTESYSCLCMCVSVRFCACVYVCMFFPPSLDLSLSLSLFLSLSLSPSLSLLSSLSLSLFLSRSLSLSLSLSIFLHVREGYVRERVCEVCEVCLKVCGFVCADKFLYSTSCKRVCVYTYIHTYTNANTYTAPPSPRNPPITTCSFLPHILSRDTHAHTPDVDK